MEWSVEFMMYWGRLHFHDCLAGIGWEIPDDGDFIDWMDILMLLICPSVMFVMDV